MDKSHMGKIYLSTFNRLCDICILVREEDVSFPKFHIFDFDKNDIELGCIGIYEAKYEGDIKLNEDDKINLNKWMKEIDPLDGKLSRWKVICQYYNPNFLDRDEIKNLMEYLDYLRGLNQPDYTLLK